MEKMKKISTVILLACLSSALFGQEIAIHGSYSLSSIDKYKHNFGFGVGYNHYINSKNRFGILVNYSISPIYYTRSFISNSDLSSCSQNIEPRNKKIDIKINYVFRVFNKLKSSLYIGPEFGLSYLLINQDIEQVTITHGVDTISLKYNSNYSENNRPSLGILIEYELKDIIIKRLSMFFTLNPEVMAYHNPALKVSNQPAIIAWLTFNIGFKYCFIKRE